MPGIDNRFSPVAYDPADDMLKIKSIQRKIRDSFSGPATDMWDVTNVGAGTVVTDAGELILTSGVGVGDFIELLSKDVFTIPFRATIGLRNTRHANNHQILEAVSVDPVTGIPDGKHVIGIDVGGAASVTATQMKYYTGNGGLRPLESAVATIVTTATNAIIEIEPFSDEAYFHSRAMDQTAGRANSYVRHQQIPDPNCVMKLRLRSQNHAAWKNITNAVAGAGGVIRLTSAAHAYANGNTVWVEALGGVTNGGAEVRGNYVIAVIDANTFELVGTTFAGAYRNGSGRVALAAAPTSVQTWVQFVNCQDYAELTAEITAGRGQVVAGQAIAAAVISMPTVTANASCTVVSAGGTLYADSAVNLGAGATFTGTARDGGATNTMRRFVANAVADQAGTLRIEQSINGTTWFAAKTAAVAANTPVELEVSVVCRYYRVVYVNGGVAQGSFLINSAYHRN